MNNEKKKLSCLNCKHSHRGERNGILHCYKHNITSVTNYDCEDYEVFVENKEDLVKLYEALKLQRNSVNGIEEKKQSLSDKIVIFEKKGLLEEEDVKESIKEFIERIDNYHDNKFEAHKKIAKEIFGKRLI